MKRILTVFFSLSLVFFLAQVSNAQVTNVGPFFVGWSPVTTATTTLPYSYDVEAQDPESDPLIYSLLSAPAGMTIDSGTGVISWTPDQSMAGTTQNVEVQVSDSVNTISRPYQITVSEENDGPSFTGWSPVTVATATQPYSYDVDATDPENDTLVFSLLSAPAGMTIDSATGVISWTPDVSMASTTQNVEVQVSDSVNVISRSYQIVVSAATSGGNVGPFFVAWSPVTTATATEPYSFDVNASDPENDPLVYSLLSAPTGMTIDSSTGVISWTPDLLQASTTPHDVEVQVTDGTNTISRPFQITVADPTVGGGNIGPYFLGWAPGTTATANQLYSYDVNAADFENDPLTFSLVSSTPSGMTINASSGLIEWTPTSGQATSTPYIVYVQVSDPTNSVIRDFQITVSDPSIGGGNIGPYFIGWAPGTTATATQSYSYDVNAGDFENDPLVFSLGTSTPSGMTINASSGLIEWTPTAGQATSTAYVITVQVNDPTNSISRDFQITVGQAPSTPTSTPPTTCTVNCGGGGGGGGSTVFVPAPPCTVNCGGGGGGSVTVTSTNLPPYFVNFNPATVVNSGQVHLYDVEAVDPENQPLTFSLLEAPSGMNILPSTGMIYWAPNSGFIRAEPYRVLIQVSDGSLVATTSYEIAVRGVITVVTTTPDEPLTPPTKPTATTTPTTTVPVVPATGNPLLALLTNILDWFRDNYCILGYLLWLLTVLAWLAYLLFGEKDDENQNEMDQNSEDLPEDLDDLISELKSEPIMEHDDALIQKN